MNEVVRNLHVGDTLQMQHAPPSDNPTRYAVKLIGYQTGQSIIITTPRKQGKPILVREGQSFTVRMLQGSNVFGFVCKVLSFSSRPYPHVHLNFPEAVESVVVRNAPRVNTQVPAMALSIGGGGTPSKPTPVTVTDLSSTGASVMLKQALGAVGSKLMLQLSLDVCGGTESLQIMGVIRNKRDAKETGGHSLYGLQFMGLNRFQQVLLCSYVLSELTEDLV